MQADRNQLSQPNRLPPPRKSSDRLPLLRRPAPRITGPRRHGNLRLRELANAADAHAAPRPRRGLPPAQADAESQVVERSLPTRLALALAKAEQRIVATAGA